ncbi:hypothetical protein AB4Y77_08335 [Paenarthrobacter sp. YAF11_1]|uniref:hypothetical protein n=1 Tax=Paenarthrobacter sp. YAF11_1 TaxID=3233074 RepID=UPI003F981B66
MRFLSKSAVVLTVVLSALVGSGVGAANASAGNTSYVGGTTSGNIAYVGESAAGQKIDGGQVITTENSH